MLTDIKILNMRLPELAWKLEQLSQPIMHKSLPRGLFRIKNPDDPQLYIKEIKDDLSHLQTQIHPLAIQFLAEKIQQKIMVLVKICKKTEKPENVDVSQINTLTRFCTRQQWLRDLKEKETSLLEQQVSLRKAAEMSQLPDVKLQLLQQIGVVEKKLTLLRESLTSGF